MASRHASSLLRRARLTPRRQFSAAALRSSNEVRIVEVGARDGLQNEKSTISLETKLELLRRLATTGVTDLEAGSFVAPKWVPQMASSAEVLNHILGHPPQSTNHIRYNFLVPNIKGLQNMLKVQDAEQVSSIHTSPSPEKSESIPEEHSPAPNTSTQDPNKMPSDTSGRTDPQEPLTETPPAPNTSSQDPNTSQSSSRFSTEISLFAAATESFSQTNTNCSIAESLERCKPIVSLAKSRGLRVRGYVSVALGCPYEGPDVDPVRVAEITRNLLEMGADEVSVADTTGMGTPTKTQALLKALTAAGVANSDIALHFHDTYGQALVNTIVGLEHGIRIFDSSVGGLGGCPYSKGATGNCATEDLNYLLESLGMKTGVDTLKMAEIGRWITGVLGRENGSRAGKAMLAKLAA